uniref:Uncharacterized protein n=2 Tax=Setaria TaxID=4554 RepID=K3ZGS0_SETIT|nr:hypothetical protein SEVIR_3G397766v2 [Setaria viridis]
MDWTCSMCMVRLRLEIQMWCRNSSIIQFSISILFLLLNFRLLLRADQRPIDMQCLISTSSLVAWWMHMYS